MSRLSPQEMVMLQGLKKLILQKIKKGNQSGIGIRAGDVIRSVINFIEKIGVPVNRITWNVFIIPLMDRLFLRKLDPSVRQSIKKFLKVKKNGRGGALHKHICCRIVKGRIICPSAGLKLAGQGLKLAGQGLTLAGQGLKLAGQGKGQGLKLAGQGLVLAGQGKSLGAKRNTRATRILRRKMKKPKIDIQDVRMGLKGLGRKNPKRVVAGKKAAKKNKWAIHLKKTFAANRGIAFKEGVKLASATFKKK